MNDSLPVLLILHAGVLHYAAGLAMLIADDARKASANKEARLNYFTSIAANIGAAASLGMGLYLALRTP